MTRHPSTCLVGVSLALAITACAGDGDSPTRPSPVVSVVEVLAALDRALEDEYKAETTYEAAIVDLGPLQPFLNVLSAEQRHSASIAALYTNRGLVAPPNTWTLATVPHYATVPQACQAAAAAERGNVAMYDELLRADLPNDVRQVFTNVRAASLLNHLPAFERCS